MPRADADPETDAALRFERFEIRPAERALLVDGRRCAIGARAFDLLLALAQRRGRLVGKQELLDLVWPGVVVEEHNIAAQTSQLRKLLGADAIATVPGRGYRLTARPLDAGPQPPAPAAAAAGAPAPQPTRLPRTLTPLLGRDEELAALAQALRHHRLVTVTGAGGIGKTLLAQHALAAAAPAHADGVCWVELAGIADGDALPARIAEALGLRLPEGGDPLAALCGATAPLALLLALDNAEHLLDAVARSAAALLEAAPALRLLVTSQLPLRLAAEQVWRVGPLALPQGALPAALALRFGAVALFAERACAADAHFVLGDDDAAAAIELCRALDGLPLAIELAAARAPLLGVRALAAAMHDRLQLLTRNRDAAAPARQRTLRAALEWSHGRLGERERIVFRRLAVLADGASLGFLQRVLADPPAEADAGGLDPWAVVDALGELVEASLVAVLPAADDDEGAPRYRLLESPRALALEQLRAAGEEAALRRRHALALAADFDAAWWQRWRGEIGLQRWAETVLRDAVHAREALAWARAADEPALAVTIAATLRLALPKSTHLERMALSDLCEALAPRVEPPALRLRALQAAVRPMSHARQQQSLQTAGRALALARELEQGAPDAQRLYAALADWVGSAAVVARPERAALAAGVAELQALEDPAWPAQLLAEGLNAMRWANSALHALDAKDEQLRLTRRWIAAIEAAGGDSSFCIGSWIDAELACGHVDEALRIGEQALARLAGSRDEWSRMMVMANLALVRLSLDDVARARPLLEAVWPLALRWDMHVLCADSPALLAALEGRPRTAARLVGYADAACATRDLIRHPNEAAMRTRTEALLRAALGDADFEALHAEGRTLRDGQVQALAFAAVDGC